MADEQPRSTTSTCASPSPTPSVDSERHRRRRERAVAVVAIAAMVASLTWSWSLVRPATSAESTRDARLAELQSLLQPVVLTATVPDPSTGHILGPSTSGRLVVLFSDFQCPGCRVFADAVRDLQRRYGPRVTVRHRHFPLTATHPAARPAAIAAECAAEQRRFTAMHDTLFARQDALGVDRWVDIARAAGVPDTVAFAMCLADPRVAGRVDADERLGDAMGIRATPAFVIDGVLYQGAISSDSLAVLLKLP